MATADTSASTLMTIDDVAELLSCSTRHVRRLTDAGCMPGPVRLGRLLRWRDRTGDPVTGLRDWLAAGCPRCDRRAGR